MKQTRSLSEFTWCHTVRRYLKASRDGSFEDLLARGRTFFLKKLNYFSTNWLINSLPTLSYSPQESKSGKLKIKPLWPKTRYQWSICYIPINTFPIVKIHWPQHNLYGKRKLPARHQPYHSLSVCRSILHNIQNQKGTLYQPISFLAKSIGKQDTFGAHCKQLTNAADAMQGCVICNFSFVFRSNL